MLTDQTLIIINAICLSFMVIMLIIMITATRMKGGAGWAAVILITTSIPAYLANLTRDFGSDSYLLCVYVGLTLNVLCFPATWFFTRKQLDKSFRLTYKSLLHAIPAVISLLTAILYYTPMSAIEVKADMAFMEAGGESLPAIINDVIVFGQFFAYFTAIFFYVRKRLRFLRNNYSDSDYLEVKWTKRFLITFFILFFGAFIGYVINPRTDIWLFPILNSIGVAYLVYIVLFHSTQTYLNRLPDIHVEAPERSNENSAALHAMSGEQMREICDKIVEYLRSSGAYTNPEFSLSMLAVETGISPKNISRSINGYLSKNFFDLVNEMRVDEAKRRLAVLDGNHTVESIYAECGFRSRSTFFAAFKKAEGKTPSQWLKISNS